MDPIIYICKSCGARLGEDEVDAVGGHCRTVEGKDGQPEPSHCGPCSPMTDSEAIRDNL